MVLVLIITLNLKMSSKKADNKLNEEWRFAIYFCPQGTFSDLHYFWNLRRQSP